MDWKNTIFEPDVRLENVLMMRLRILTPVVVISTLLSTACTESESEAFMPVTTDSELALEFYETGMLAFDQLKWELAWYNLELAVKEDPDFFMAYFWMYYISSKSPKEIAEKAAQSAAPLNEAEKEIKAAFKYLLDGQEEKVVEHLQSAIDLYPDDPHLHKILYIFQLMIFKDHEGAEESLRRAIEEQPKFAAAYNYLGYALMYQNNFDEAEEILDKYISLAPNIANPYDSKGDFYMYTEQYKKAYESYTKAIEIDSSFQVSQKKALKAKKLLAELEE